jgi:hypothetical protein
MERNRKICRTKFDLSRSSRNRMRAGDREAERKALGLIGRWPHPGQPEGVCVYQFVSLTRTANLVDEHGGASRPEDCRWYCQAHWWLLRAPCRRQLFLAPDFADLRVLDHDKVALESFFGRLRSNFASCSRAVRSRAPSRCQADWGGEREP